MSFIFRGNLCGYLCDDCMEPLSNALIRVYRLSNPDQAGAEAAANPKYTVQILDEKAISAKEDLLLGEGKLDDGGNFSIVLDDSYHNYGGPLAIDVRVLSVPGQKAADKDPVQFTLTILQPQWRQSDDDLIFSWEYCLSDRIWCYIRSLFDAWVICGTVVSCEDQETPLVGVKVTAFDADWLKDDELGSSFTGEGGHFRIDYSSADFKQTFLSPVINVETPFPPFNSGPDVYFTIETAGGQMLYEETRGDGKVAGRENRGPCFCVDLCVDVVPEDDTLLASAWTGIGTAFTIPIGADLNDFDPAGYAGSLKYAFTSRIRMTGQVAISSTNKALQGNPIEYRFLVSDAAGVNGGAPLSAASFTKVVGVETGLFAKTKVGQMWYLGSPFKVVDVYAEQADLDTEGWLDVNQSVKRTFDADPSLNSADLTDPIEGPKWFWVDLDGMMAMQTSVLTDNSMPSVTTPGDIIPGEDRKGIQKIAIRFEIREVIDKASNQFVYLPGSGQTLNAMVVNNTAAAQAFDIQELSGMPCATLSGNINAVYTVHHPHLEDVSIGIRSNDNVINAGLTGPGLPMTNNLNDSLTHLHSSGLSVTQAPNSLTLKTCAYIATLRVKRRLHNGESSVAASHIQKAFYYQA